MDHKQMETYKPPGKKFEIFMLKNITNITDIQEDTDR